MSLSKIWRYFTPNHQFTNALIDHYTSTLIHRPIIKTLFITPPFTQLNTPYPATAYLKGFLNTKGYDSYQADLGIEVILELFSPNGLKRVFAEAENIEEELTDNSERIIVLKDEYLATIRPVILFLQNKNPIGA